MCVGVETKGKFNRYFNIVFNVSQEINKIQFQGENGSIDPTTKELIQNQITNLWINRYKQLQKNADNIIQTGVYGRTTLNMPDLIIIQTGAATGKSMLGKTIYEQNLGISTLGYLYILYQTVNHNK